MKLRVYHDGKQNKSRITLVAENNFERNWITYFGSGELFETSRCSEYVDGERADAIQFIPVADSPSNND